ncbi:hypothetical protein [Streptomyces sp. AC550_RSS872]|uniref:hypothetical protein n=1 Tax=Streptomyces sp. AC550_RSS872 TaxID=2823689 RepID=UPI001C265E32|nr:hypothetical protein [Streptomyces sp. AC550_RSS872]
MSAAAGVGSVILAVNISDPVMRLVAVFLAVVFLGPLVLMLVIDIREWLGRPPPESDPTGRPQAAEWGFVVVFDSAMALFVYAGVLDVQRGGSGELLVGGLMVSVPVLFLTIGVVIRWWRHRRARRSSRLPGGPE